MASIEACELPYDALLRRYLDRGAYTDCYVTELARPVQQAEYVEAFYTTTVFKLERLLLSWLVARPSTDAQARELASGHLTTFAAWNVEARETDQVLLADFQGPYVFVANDQTDFGQADPQPSTSGRRWFPLWTKALAKEEWGSPFGRCSVSTSSTPEYSCAQRSVALRVPGPSAP